jgi:hypothetical protein
MAGDAITAVTVEGAIAAVPAIADTPERVPPQSVADVRTAEQLPVIVAAAEHGVEAQLPVPVAVELVAAAEQHMEAAAERVAAEEDHVAAASVANRWHAARSRILNRHWEQTAAEQTSSAVFHTNRQSSPRQTSCTSNPG